MTRKWTPEQKKAASDRAKARAIIDSTVASPPPSTGDPLKDLAALIVQAASKDAADDKIIEQFTQLLEHIDFGVDSLSSGLE